MSWIGVIADTHGLLRPEAIAALAGVDLIIHAGDVGSSEVLDGLRQIAPVVAVRGKEDFEPFAEALPRRELVDYAGIRLYVLHDVRDLDVVPEGARINVVVSGYTHEVSLESRGLWMILNPGSAGPCRGPQPATLALLYVSEGDAQVKLVELAKPEPR